ncbi:SDR family oxidoreductase [Amycolatopsis rubida]|uniref:SDR family oxidoreductase n=2 Tax=Amycolatopsis rubida TaxID=112413 RepID=A0ABX0BI08_9PSEU|nr:SDR family oxidoreductase [Amycolatopsis sp. M39]MYW90049.1 SDR family oxidoreductase [Amycolatopsis rubida]NEC55026.1 SDR family oxidoreductase [Amycolatopsis rubida]
MASAGQPVTAAAPVALVTGASGLLGARVADLLGRRGIPTAHHYANRNPSSAPGLPQISVRADLGNTSEVEAMMDEVRERLGPVGILVHCAATAADGLIIDQDEKTWREVVDVNLVGAYRVIRCALPSMVRRRYGRIVVASSPSALRGVPGQSAYASAKAGLLGLVRTLAAEYAPRNILVNAVTPGFMDSELTVDVSEQARAAILARTVRNRPLDPALAAEAVLFLLDNDAVTGHNLVVDGGFSLC